MVKFHLNFSVKNLTPFSPFETTYERQDEFNADILIYSLRKHFNFVNCNPHHSGSGNYFNYSKLKIVDYFVFFILFYRETVEGFIFSELNEMQKCPI